MPIITEARAGMIKVLNVSIFICNLRLIISQLRIITTAGISIPPSTRANTVISVYISSR